MKKYFNQADGIIVGIQPGVGNEMNLPPSHDVAADRVMFKVDFMHHGMSNEALVAQIISGVIQNLPHLTVKDISNGMLGAFDKIVWESVPHNDATDVHGYSWVQSFARGLNRTTNSIENKKVRDIHGEEQKKRELLEKQRKDQAIELMMTEEELLRAKFSHVEDVDDMTLAGLKELDEYMNNLKTDSEVVETMQL